MFEKYVRQIKYKNWEFKLDKDYLQVCFIDERGEEQKGRKWRLSKHMTKSEFVQTALKAVLAAEEHEARERFEYRGEKIFGPHFDVDSLHMLAFNGNLDVRS